MYNYHADIVWAINSAFLIIIVLTSMAIFLCVMFKDYLWKKRRRELLAIKNNIYEMILAGKDPQISPPPVIQKATPQQFIDVETNRGRDAIFFNDAEQQFFKKCFITPENITRLIKTAKSSWNKWKKIEAMLCLGYAETEKAIEVLSESALSKDKDIASLSLVALGHIKTRRSAEVLLGVLKKDPTDRYKISSMLDSFPLEIADDIIGLTDDDNFLVRSLALTLLSKFGPRRYIKKLERLTTDAVPEVRAAACDCLGSIGSSEVKPALTARLQDDNWLVKMHAILALEKALGDKAVPEVIGLINDASWSVNSAVRDVMASHIEVSLPYIEKFLIGKDEIAKKYSIFALESSGYLSKLLQNAASGKDKDRTMKLLEEIVEFGPHLGLDAALNELDPAIRAKAQDILNKINRQLTNGHT